MSRHTRSVEGRKIGPHWEALVQRGLHWCSPTDMYEAGRKDAEDQLREVAASLKDPDARELLERVAGLVGA